MPRWLQRMLLLVSLLHLFVVTLMVNSVFFLSSSAQGEAEAELDNAEFLMAASDKSKRALDRQIAQVRMHML